MTKQTSDALEIMKKRYYKTPERQQELQEAFVNDDVARKLRQLRENAGLTTRQLAEIVGTSHTNISRLESADYEGHSLSMLNRIANALEMRVKIDFVPLQNQDVGSHNHLSR